MPPMRKPPTLALALVAVPLLAASDAAAGARSCPPLWTHGVLELPWRPAFMRVDRYDDGDGLTVSSFYNAYRNPQPGPPFITYARDRVARIPGLAGVDPATFDAATDVEELTDRELGPGGLGGRTVWPNEAARAPDGAFPFEAVVVPQGFHPAIAPGRLTAIDVATGDEYVIHQSTQAASGFTFPGDPANSPRFYHRALFHDMDGDGLLDIVTARSGFRVFPSVYPPFAELVYFVNPGAALDPATPWREVVLWGGPPAGFMGPDIHLAMHDFEGDGVPEIVATHFFTGAPSGPGQPPPQHGTVALYGAPAGGTWADVDASRFRLPRVAVLSADQGFPFDAQPVDLDHDGTVDLLVTNHQPDNCTPATSSAVPGRVYALTPPRGDVFTRPWTRRTLLDEIRPNPSLPGASSPGRLAPGKAHVFWPMRLFAGLSRPWIVVGGDEAGKVWVLRPTSLVRGWGYEVSVIFDLNDFYGEGTTQTPRPPGVVFSTIGEVAVRYDRRGWLGFAELYIPAFEAHDIHVMSMRPGHGGRRLVCPTAAPVTCPGT